MATDRDHSERRVIAQCSDAYRAELIGSIEVIGRSSIATTLDANRTLDVEKRRELIKALRAGEHAELGLKARTFRQKMGSPNSKFLRHREDHLPVLAESFKGMPFLLDHRGWDQRARMGTILDSQLHDHGGTGWKSLDQTLHVVKPDAVISVLDGTLDRFSIGWSRGAGDVTCSVHGASILGRDACDCWPGDKLTIDGQPSVVEWEYQEAVGTETSAVNVPAVGGTRIQDVRAALAAELEIVRPHHQEIQMQFTRLAALLGLTSLSSASDEDRAITAIENQKRALAAAEQERDTAKSQLSTSQARATKAEQALLSTTETAIKTQVDAILEGGYRDGKLRYGRDESGKAVPSGKEPRLRRIAKDDGLEALRAELAEMEAVVPVGQRVLTESTPQPRRTEPTTAPAFNRAVAETVAEQLGLKVEDLMPEGA